jgi:hypothetical protein
MELAVENAFAFQLKTVDRQRTKPEKDFRSDLCDNGYEGELCYKPPEPDGA